MVLRAVISLSERPMSENLDYLESNCRVDGGPRSSRDNSGDKPPEEVKWIKHL